MNEKIEVQEENTAVSKTSLKVKIKNTWKRCIDYLKANKYFSTLILILSLVILALIISLFQMKN
jgi:lipopolysaccharide/colanic/teichoic acid biosynthesis glycosyltransferase